MVTWKVEPRINWVRVFQGFRQIPPRLWRGSLKAARLPFIKGGTNSLLLQPGGPGDSPVEFALGEWPFAVGDQESFGWYGKSTAFFHQCFGHRLSGITEQAGHQAEESRDLIRHRDPSVECRDLDALEFIGRESSDEC